MTVERRGLESQVRIGPYANHVTPISGAFTFTAWHKGDSLDGVAEWLTRDGARWRLALDHVQTQAVPHYPRFAGVDRKSTRLNSSHGYISYAVFCLKKKKTCFTESRGGFDRLDPAAINLHTGDRRS